LKPSRKLSRKPIPSAPASAPATGPGGAVPAARLKVFRLLAATAIPLLLIVLLEAGLRVGGYGYSPRFFQKASIQQQQALVDNPKFSYRFFPPELARMATPVIMRADKPAGSVRIFVFGESAALGDPRPQYGAARYLEALLRLKYPERSFEVVNTSMTAVNSHVIREIARDCADKQGDIWLVYMGNNEMVGPFGAATVFGPQAPPLWMVRLTTRIQEWRAGQLLMALGRSLKAGKAARAQWRGMQMFLHNLVPPGDPRRAMVHDSYRRNLRAIVRAGEASGAKVILSTVAVNTRDCPPFAGVVTNTLSTGDRTALERVLASGAAAESAGDWAKATNTYLPALKRFPEVAELRYRLGRALLNLNDRAAARENFNASRDLDALPFRADSHLNRAVMEMASQAGSPGGRLCNAEAALGDHTGAGPGAESFYEHVHLNFDGNYRLGLAWANSVEQLLPDDVKRGGQWPSQRECEAALGLTDWNRRSVLLEVLDRLEQPPLSTQSNNAERKERLKQWLTELERSIKTASKEDARSTYTAAIQSAPGDYRLHENYAEFLEDVGDLAGAIAERRTVRDLTPHYYFSHYILGKSLKQQKQFAEARECLLKAAELKPDQAEVYLELGSVEALEGKWDESLAVFMRALELDPGNPRLHQLSADVLWRLNRRTEAVEALRRAVAIRPSHPEARYRLGEMLALSGDVPAAAKEFAEVLRMRPDHVAARVNLGVALAQLGRAAEAIREFDEALRLEPDNALAKKYKRTAEQQAGGQQ